MTAPTSGKIGTGFGVKGDWAAGYHPGVDYPVPPGTRVNACAPSTIIHAGTGTGGWGAAYGIHVIGECVVGGRRYQWITAHLSKTVVKKGAHVVAGQQVGLSGYTGNVRPKGPKGAHVHFEARVYPFNYFDHVNPGVLINYRPGVVDRMDPTNYGPGHVGPHITWLGNRLVRKGFGDYYRDGPGPVWGDADRRNVAQFQRAQGWTGKGADGFPGVETLKRLARD